MPVTTIGQSGLVFGLTTEGIGLVQSFSETRNVEKSEVKDATGDIKAVAYFNATDSYSLSVAVTGSYSVTAGAAIVIANASSSGGSTRIDSISQSKSNDAFVMIDISATRYPNVS
jgi:hypothetical protein